MTEDQQRQAARLYYLDCRSVRQIAEELHVPREKVRAAIDDPGLQAEYLQKTEAIRSRTRARAAAAADIALERQVDFLQQDVDAELIPAQQRTAAAVYRQGMNDMDDGSAVKVVFANGPIKLGMPRAMVPGKLLEVDDND